MLLLPEMRASSAGSRNGDGLMHGFANLVGFSPQAGDPLDEATAWLRDRLV